MHFGLKAGPLAGGPEPSRPARAARAGPAPAAGKSSNAGTVRNVALGCLYAFCWRVTPVNQAISHVREALLTRPSYIGAARQPQPAPGSAGASLGGWRWGWWA